MSAADMSEEQLRGLLEYSENAYQDRLIKAVIEHGNPTAAAKVLGINDGCARRSFRRVMRAAERRGYSPARDLTHPIPDSHRLKRVSTLYNSKGAVSQQWVIQEPDAVELEETARTLIETLAEEHGLEPVDPSSSHPETVVEDLISQYTITDSHVGMYALGEETKGADWCLETAERLLTRFFSHSILHGPPSELAILAQLGDFSHFDSWLAVTPSHGHHLDASGRFQQIVRVCLRVMVRAVELLLEKHAKVLIVNVEGNHDLSTSAVFREALALYYSREPRVEVDATMSPLHVHRFGRVLLAYTHGHKMRDAHGTITERYPTDWGETVYRYIHTGHRHHDKTTYKSGLYIEQHETLAPPDAYSAGLGYGGHRSAKTILYHRQFGRVGELVFTPEILAR